MDASHSDRRTPETLGVVDFPVVCPEVLTRPAMSTFFERVRAALTVRCRDVA